MSEIERLESVNKRLRAVLDTAVDAIITINKAGIIESFNPAAERIFGYTADEILGKSVNLLMPSPFREQHDSYLQNYFQTGEKKIIGIGREVPALRKDGTTFPAHIAVSEMLLGEERLFTGILRDVSIQKRAEERARQAERLAAIGQTVTGLAHESRNAFQRSKSCLEMLAIELEGQADPLELVGRTQRALDHVHHLYEEVRDYAAPLNLEPQPCNITRIWRDAWSQLEIVGKQKNVELREELAGA
ncbi:MAG: PAS domain S-box protein, partial [Pirellulaceae bacterium]|nr:PAS domain S-box protein [Pirellulaceae bacterium]